MENFQSYNEAFTALIPRIFLGILFFAQGYDKVFKLKLSKVTLSFKQELGETQIPNWLLVISAYFTSYSELLGGFFLIVGCCKYFFLWLLGIDLILVAIAMSLLKPLWDMKFVFPRLALIITLLLLPSEWDKLSIDYLYALKSLDF